MGADTQVPVKFGYSFQSGKVNVPLSSKSSTGKKVLIGSFGNFYAIIDVIL
ncbi:hypothetical protein [Bacillus cereus]|uniref:hypothetical protein n=1 Tax=Bacillus cereus TaxID=1396 RepID=UPI0014821E93|nr:hypothetical protein [Bacillus cereus]